MCIRDRGTLVNYVEEILTDGDPVPATYNVEQNLTNVSSTFTGTAVNKGEKLTATLTAEADHTIQTPTVTMNGQDVTASAWNSTDGTVTLESVPGDVIITAAATANA